MNSQAVLLGEHGTGSVAALGTKESTAVEETKRRMYQLMPEYKGNDLRSDMWFEPNRNKDGIVKGFTVYVGQSKANAVLLGHGNTVEQALNKILEDPKLDKVEQMERITDAQMGEMAEYRRRR